MRVFNFSAGPAVLPLEVLEQARDEMTDWNGGGMSVMEISHRSKAFVAVAQQAEADLRELLSIPTSYKVLFLQGGATGQFSAVPLNLAAEGATVVTSTPAPGRRRPSAKPGATTRSASRRMRPTPATTPCPRSRPGAIDPAAAYLHYTPNETIGGVEFPFVPAAGSVAGGGSVIPLVADMSSTILSRPIDVSRFGLIYAGAQKNIGPAGITVVIVREDLIGKARPATPMVFDYKAMADDGSMLNTPPTFGWYFAGLVFKWLKRQGGLAAMAERNRAKAERLYAAIDASGFYRNPVAKNARSWMNVPFTLARPELDKEFLAQAGKTGLANLEGHRSVGGMRASLYNAMPLEGVNALVEFMQEFQRRHA